MNRCGCSAAPCEMPRLAVNFSYSTHSEVRAERFDFSDLASVDRGLAPSDVVTVFSFLAAALALSHFVVWRHARHAAWCVLDLKGFHAFMTPEKSARRRRWDLRLRLSEKEKRFFAFLSSFVSRSIRSVRPNGARA